MNAAYGCSTPFDTCGSRSHCSKPPKEERELKSHGTTRCRPWHQGSSDLRRPAYWLKTVRFAYCAGQVPFRLARATARRPAACSKPAASSFSTRATFDADQELLGFRGVK